jgi:hypothetical protein
MRKLKSRLMAVSLAASLGLTVGGAAIVRASQSDNPQSSTAAAAEADPVCRRQSAANASGQDILLSTANPKTYTGTAWVSVNCASTTFRLKYGERALVTSHFNAEADCNGTTPTNGQWCLTRALLNGVEGVPVAAEPDSFAFDGVAGGTNNWQAHSMVRGWEIRCGVQEGCQYKYVVQTRMHDASVTGMWLDEVAAHLRVTYGAPAPL